MFWARLVPQTECQSSVAGKIQLSFDRSRLHIIKLKKIPGSSPLFSFSRGEPGDERVS